ncbi:N-methylhydantoinase A [Roseiarcus fermentans]|uniref:N-methylhydantoinase A n=1 Tax=Roseiarcus fermentans TaxID=1473586 RepID=A0A366FJ25_9HYPH|nr:hydantoinase/oxoprolinase family protein [Roseiarcus fermentans]RBP13990.1 N-methylhydantoinase A [Roseiarcus fermentans]
MRFGVDTGGTFTDLIVEDDGGELHMFKAATTPADPIRGVLDALKVAADGFGVTVKDLLGRSESFIYGTTHAINAIITGNVAKTAFVTTVGHPDVLTLREGGRTDPFDFTVPYPEPYVPRSLTFEAPGRIRADGSVQTPFDDAAMVAAIEAMKHKKVEAVAVCLLWSIVNPEHELRVGELLDRRLPNVPYTLSHRLNPTLREYRRASSSCIDASLKPMMAAYMERLTRDLRDNGLTGRALVVTSQGGVMDAAEVALKPIHLLNSGPSMAPISGRYFAEIDEGSDTAIIADTGGTTYDISLVSRGRIPWTRETWIGQPFRGHMTGFASVDVKSVGAGGGSIAWVDDGGMLHVGPKSAGAVPGPVCYGKGGTLPTVTDAAVVLGYIDPAFFLGGAITLDTDKARAAIEAHVAEPLGRSVEEAALAIIEVVTENMVQAIVDITVNQGIDPSRAVLVGGGGAAGINSVLIARRLDSPRLLIPEVGAALSAAGALMSDLTQSFHATRFCETRNFDFAAANDLLDKLKAQCRVFIAEQAASVVSSAIQISIEARYPEQVWEINVPLSLDHFAGPEDVAALERAFHQAHEEIFAISDAASSVEIVGWSAAAICRLHDQTTGTLAATAVDGPHERERQAYFPGYGHLVTQVRRFEAMKPGETVEGPAIIESAVTSVVLHPGSSAVRRPSGSLSISPGA